MGYWLDASYLIALMNRRDAHHKDALRKLAVLQKDRARRHTHPLVLGELSAVLLKARDGKAAAGAVRDVMDDCDVREVDDGAVEDALPYVTQYGISLSDALLLAFCLEDEGVLVTYDADFKGKARLL